MGNVQNKKLIFQTLSRVIGFTPKVVEYYDQIRTSKIDIYIGTDRPDFGISTYSTIGLSKYPIDLTNKNGEDIRVEFISICNSDVVKFPNIIATCAFNIINNNYSCRPGTVYPDIVKEYYDGKEMEHVYFTSPFLWEELQNIYIDNNVVTWLLAMPISNNEFEFLKINGSDALEDLLEKNSVDIFDINRKSIL